MSILPRFLFLFQNLPLYITPTCANIWEGLLRTFLWDKKRPRVKLKVLQQKKGGGFALPNLINYYYAAHVKLILIWMNNEMNPSWKLIKSSLVEPLSTLILSGYRKAQISIRNYV